MRRAILLFILLTLTCAITYAQGKGVDNQNDRIRDASNDRSPGNNGIKQDVGAGRGIDFGRGRTVTPPPLPNPYKIAARKDAIIQAVEALMRERRLVRDDAVSKPNEGIIITQPFTFIKGAVVTQSELNRYAEVPDAESRGWTRARYTLVIEVQPIDGNSSNLSVTAKIEGRTDGASGAEWVTLRSTGTAEQEFISALVENVTGTPPPPPTPPQP